MRHVLGVGMNIAGDILRAESSSPPYHVHWTKLIFRLWSSLQSKQQHYGSYIWKDNIILFLKGCRTCWSYKVLKFAFVADITKFDPDKTYFSQYVLDAICTFSFDERLVMNCVNTLYEARYSNYVGICPKTAPNKGYSICKYINWTGTPGSICIKNKYK